MLAADSAWAILCHEVSPAYSALVSPASTTQVRLMFPINQFAASSPLLVACLYIYWCTAYLALAPVLEVRSTTLTVVADIGID